MLLLTPRDPPALLLSPPRVLLRLVAPVPAQTLALPLLAWSSSGLARSPAAAPPWPPRSGLGFRSLPRLPPSLRHSLVGKRRQHCRNQEPARSRRHQQHPDLRPSHATRAASQPQNTPPEGHPMTLEQVYLQFIDQAPPKMRSVYLTSSQSPVLAHWTEPPPHLRDFTRICTFAAHAFVTHTTPDLARSADLALGILRGFHDPSVCCCPDPSSPRGT